MCHAVQQQIQQSQYRYTYIVARAHNSLQIYAVFLAMRIFCPFLSD